MCTQQPSRDILNFGKPYDDTAYYFVADGTATFDDETTISCSFEALYTENYEMFAVAHIRRENFIVWLHKAKKCQKLEGRTNTGKNVKLEEFRHRNGPTVPSGAAKYEAFIFEVIDDSTGEQRSKWQFDIIGFPFPEDTAEISFPLNQGTELKLIKAVPEHGKPITHLTFEQEYIPDGWVAQGIAGAWCQLVSIALGKKVQLFTATALDKEGRTLIKDYSYISVDERAFLSAIIEYPDLRPQENQELVIDFVRQALTTIMSGDPWIDNTSAGYGLAIYEYIEYSFSGITLYGLARLMVTLVEELLHTWEGYIGNEARLLKIGSSKYKRLRKKIQQVLKREPEKYLAENLAGDKLDQIIERITELIPNKIEKSYPARLKSFFKHYDYDPEQLNYENRIELYVKSRNSIVHTGRFPSDVDEMLAIKNAIMMFPLMLFCIFNYEGKYFDFPSNCTKVWEKRKL